MKFIEVYLTKSNMDDIAGVAMGSGSNILVISKITEGGLFETSAKGAKVGMRVLRINGVSIDGMSTEDAVAIIKGAEGKIPFLLQDGKTDAELTAVSSSDIQSSTVDKTPDGKVKFSFSGTPGAIQVTKIAEGSPFEKTSLKIGGTLLAVNNVSLMGMDVEQTRDILGQANDPVTLIYGSLDAVATGAMVRASGVGEVPPPGSPVGGSWGTVRYIGPLTQQCACIACLVCCISGWSLANYIQEAAYLFGLPGCCVLLCPSDEMEVYKVDGKLYKANGSLCTQFPSSFVPTQPRMTR